jgi:hypothetical protein
MLKKVQWAIDDLLDWMIKYYPEVAKEFYYSLGEEE